MTNPSGSNPWSTYMLEIYGGRRGPQPLGTVNFDKLEQLAIEKLKQWPGMSSLRIVLVTSPMLMD